MSVTVAMPVFVTKLKTATARYMIARAEAEGGHPPRQGSVCMALLCLGLWGCKHESYSPCVPGFAMTRMMLVTVDLYSRETQ